MSVEGLKALNDLDKLRKWNPDIKVVLSVGGWGAGGFSEMAMTQRGRQAFVSSAMKTLDRYRLDGIDIDWEYPCSSSAGIASSPEDRKNFTLLMKTLREAAGERIVSIAAGAGAYFVRDTEMELVAKACDYVQLMTYDMRSGFDHQAGHHAALDASPGDETGMTVRRAVTVFENAGVPAEKIVIGAAFYSRRWTGVPDINKGLLQQAESVGNYGPGYAELKRDYIGKNGWEVFWDEAAKASYLWNGSELISYDDPGSLQYKCEYLKEAGLLGIMYWEHSCDDTGTLLSAIHRALY